MSILAIGALLGLLAVLILVRTFERAVGLEKCALAALAAARARVGQVGVCPLKSITSDPGAQPVVEVLPGAQR